jgi:hypothetical protein
MKRINLSKTILVAGFITACFGTLAGTAEAKTKVGIYFGVPFYDTQVDDGYFYEPDYGWYAPEYRPMWRRHFPVARISCDQAARDLRNSGFRSVRAIECQGRTYTFRARRSGRLVTLSYNARTGDFNRI